MMRRTSILLVAGGLLIGCSDDGVDGGAGGADATGGGAATGTGGAGGNMPTCGDGVIGVGEDCDGTNLAGATCESEGFGPGTLACAADCSFDVNGCSPPPGCGNGALDGGEACDGDDLGGATCASEGFSAGMISCDPRCMLDTSACCDDACPSDGATQCDGDTVQTCSVGANGCLEWQNSTDCTTNEEVCYDGGAGATCIVPCTDECTTGASKCVGNVVETCTVNSADGCNDWVASSDCTVTSQLCDPTQAACVTPPSGDTCADPYPLGEGNNQVFWTATGAEYISAPPACVPEYADPIGPDLVLEYTPSVTGYLDLQIPKPSQTRWVILVSSAPCGSPTPEYACISDWSPPEIVYSGLPVAAGTTYYFYVIATDSGSAPLNNPLEVNLTLVPANCSAYQAQVVSTSPATGEQVVYLDPTIEVEFDTAVDPTTGVISLTGTNSTQTFDLSLNPPEVSVANNVLTITPASFVAPETITVSWSGLFDGFCGSPIPSPAAYSFDAIDPGCFPGVGGVVGTTPTTVGDGGSVTVEYYVVADDDPNGWIYSGGGSYLWRVPKAGGAPEDVELAAGLGTIHMGYTMIVVGQEIYTVDSKTTGTTGHLYRVSTDGGATWNIEDYASFPSVPVDDFRGIAHHNGLLYLVTFDDAAGQEIWTVPVGGVGQQTATLLGTVNEIDCGGIAVDDVNVYLACADGDRLVRAPLSSAPAFTTELISTSYDMSTTTSTLHMDDLDNDGIADVLYAKSLADDVWYVCNPAGATPFVAPLVTYAGSGYGLGFDRVAKSLFIWEDTPDEVVRID